MPQLTNFVGYVEFNPNGTIRNWRIHAKRTLGHQVLEDEETTEAIYQGLINAFGYEGGVFKLV